jgi:hypothetical protein
MINSSNKKSVVNKPQLKMFLKTKIYKIHKIMNKILNKKLLQKFLRYNNLQLIKSRTLRVKLE